MTEHRGASGHRTFRGCDGGVGGWRGPDEWGRSAGGQRGHRVTKGYKEVWGCRCTPEYKGCRGTGGHRRQDKKFDIKSFWS